MDFLCIIALNEAGCNLWEFQNQKIVRKDSYRKTVTTPA
jgi:hypothetical protein